MSLGQRKLAEEMYVVTATDMVADPDVYLPFTQVVANNSEFQHPVRQATIWNLTNGDVLLSFNSNPTDSTSPQEHDHMVIPANGYWTDDTATNRQATADIYNWEKGAIFWARRSNLPNAASPTTGAIVLTICYAYGE